MSTPDPNSAAPVTASPSLVTASETPATPTNVVKTLPSQPPPTPPPLPPPYRVVAPVHHPNPFQQQAHNNNNLYANSIPVRRPNQDPSGVMYPFAPLPVQGFSPRPVRMSSPFVADSSVPSGNQSGYPPRPVDAYNQRQFSPNQMEAMMQFMRARNPQIHQFPHPGSGSLVGSGPMRGIPPFLQPRVSTHSTSVLDTTSRNRNARNRDEALVLVKGRKVRITEGASLYSVCRSWLRNGAHVRIQPQRSDTMKPLPRPLPVEMTEASVPNDPAEEQTDLDKEDEESVKELSEKDLLKRHVERAKKVRARLREERLRKIARYKARLALLLPQSGEQCRKDDKENG